MKAVIYERFAGPIAITHVAEPETHDDGAVIKVLASGICRSDWHGWMGHDPDIKALPHVPGHELAGIVESVGTRVTKWRPGARVTLPFVAGCGACPECDSGNHQICDNQYQPGFSGWGSFAEYVAVRYADVNLVGLPDEMDFTTAASLGCRFSTSYRAVTVQGGVKAGEWVVVHGCGGVGLSAIIIAHALGARVVGVDIDQGALDLAASLGAAVAVNAASEPDVPAAVRAATGGGAHVSLDALGSARTCANSLLCLRKRGRHVQVGLLAGEDYRPALPMEQVIARELEIRGSHGLQASKYPELLEMIVSGKMNPRSIVRKTISLEDAPDILQGMGEFGSTGITVIDRF